MSCTGSRMVLRKIFICATTTPRLPSGAQLGRTCGRFCCTVQYCLCLLARSGLLIPTQSSPDLVRSTTLEYTHPSLTTPAQFTWDHAQLRTAYALHYRTLYLAATILRGPSRDKRAPTTRLVSSSRPGINVWFIGAQTFARSGHHNISTVQTTLHWLQARHISHHILAFSSDWILCDSR
jgi:hypothetical protein